MRALTNWLKTLRRNKIVLLLLALPFTGFSQLITLDEAYALAREHYPLIKQKDLIRQTEELNISNISKGLLPQLSINGQASYQSEVTSVKVNIPGVNISAPEKDQYRLTADLSQLVYDGGLTRQQKVLQLLDAKAQDQQVELEMYKLKERIIQVFLGILFLDEQLRQAALVKNDLGIGIKKVQAQVQNGVAFKSNLSALQAESLKADQRTIEIKSSRKGLMETLGLFINKKLDENTVLEPPSPPSSNNTEITRPEIKLYSDQSAVLDHQYKMIRARNLPKTSLFLQGGYGRPGLNLLKNEFDPFYIGGLRFNWSLGGWYTQKNDKRLIQVNQQIIDSRKQTFLLNTATQLSQQQSEVEKLNQLIDADNEIVVLRKSVTDAAKAQLDNGVITANDYLREVNAEDMSRQNMIAHQIQLLQAKINYQTITGK
ncbi:MAG: TolC family protein [Flavitalea sp.]